MEKNNEPHTAEQWVKAIIENNPTVAINDDLLLMAFRRAQEQARKETLEKITSEDGGDEFALVCFLKEKNAGLVHELKMMRESYYRGREEGRRESIDFLKECRERIAAQSNLNLDWFMEKSYKIVELK